MEIDSLAEDSLGGEDSLPTITMCYGEQDVRVQIKDNEQGFRYKISLSYRGIRLAAGSGS